MSETRLRRALVPLLDWIAPPRCAACDRLLEGDDVFCGPCGETLQEPPSMSCTLCGDPGWEGRCPRCRESPPAFSRARAAFAWGGELATAVRRYKYGGRMELAAPLGRLFASHLERAGEGAEALVTVPLSSAGLRRRGFDQVVELVRGARWSGARLPPLLLGALSKPRDRPAQASLPPSARRRLPRSAFKVRRRGSVAGRSLLLVDDVMTTGATAGACASLLRGAGAERLEVISLARAG